MRACSPLHRHARADEEGTRDTGRRVAEAGCAREVAVEVAVDGVHGILGLLAVDAVIFGILGVDGVFPCDWRRALQEEEEEEEEEVQGIVRIRSGLELQPRYARIAMYADARAVSIHRWPMLTREPTSAYVSIRQHTSAYVSIRYVSIRQHTSA
jgi:hypothetical protein